MTDTMIKRMARAAHDEHNDDFAAHLQATDPEWDGWKSWAPVMRAVLTAMREPTGAMNDAGRWPAEDDGPDACWQAMIDAALAEGG